MNSPEQVSMVNIAKQAKMAIAKCNLLARELE